MIEYPEITIIIGSGRSGTSYLQRTLRESLNIGFFREPKFIIPLYRHLHRFPNLEDAATYLRRLAERLHQTHFWNI
jgi:hypothetical protein